MSINIFGGRLRNCAVGFILLFFPSSAAAQANVWIGTWATAPQAAMRGRVMTFHNQTLRLIVHVSASGQKARVRISNTFGDQPLVLGGDRKSTRLNSSHMSISYAVFCLKKKKKKEQNKT